jgi:hypothetical protein
MKGLTITFASIKILILLGELVLGQSFIYISLLFP